MLTADQIAAFEAESQPAFTAGKAFVRRKRKGLPPDRWATTNSMELVAECIERQWAIMALMTDVISNMQAELIRRGDESIGVYDRNGNRTS